MLDTPIADEMFLGASCGGGLLGRRAAGFSVGELSEKEEVLISLVRGIAPSTISKETIESRGIDEGSTASVLSSMMLRSIDCGCGSSGRVNYESRSGR